MTTMSSAGVLTSQTNDVGQNRQRLSKMLQFQGYSACREALVLLEDHFTSSTKYNSIEDFIIKLNRIITFNIKAESSVIDPDLAYQVIRLLSCNEQQVGCQPGNDDQQSPDPDVIADPVPEIPTDLVIKVKNVEHEQQQPTAAIASGNHHSNQKSSDLKTNSGKQTNEFNIHYNFLFKRLNSLPIFKETFQLMRLDTLTGSTQPSIRCICFGLLVKDISKIDGYMLIDSTGRVPVRLTADTTFRNRLAYTNCIVLVEGVYINPDDILFAANIGLPPCLVDPIPNKALACQDEKLIVILKELYLDDDDACKAIEMLFTGYNSMEDPPIAFVMIGDFTRYPCRSSGEMCGYTKRLIRLIRSCDNLKSCHFIFVPGPRDACILVDGELKDNPAMPKAPFTREQVPINLLHLAGFENCHLATNPTHIYLNDRHISIVGHSYFKELKKNLLHDLSDRNEEFFETAQKILLSNAHLAAGISKTYHSSMNLWHKPDLLILADTEAFGNKYDYSSSKQDDTSFATVPSFSRQFNQFKVYYVRSGEIEDSQVSSDALQEIEDEDDDDDDNDDDDDDNDDKDDEGGQKDRDEGREDNHDAVQILEQEQSRSQDSEMD